METIFDFWPASGWQILAGAAFIAFFTVVVAVVAKWGAYWLQAYMSGADVSMKSLVVMSLLGIEHRLIVNAKVMGRQSGLSIDRQSGMSTARLQSHYLAGGNVMKVVGALIAAERAGLDLSYEDAAAIDLAGRDVLLAVQSSVSPIVISCPDQEAIGKKSLSAVAKNGVELLVGVKVTVRTKLDQVVGGAMEDTVVARLGQAVVSAIGSASSHMEVLGMPSQISKSAMAHGLDTNTAFSIVSIDIADIDVGENIGARLETEQAHADTRVARAQAEVRRATAVARKQQMIVKVREAQANLLFAEAEVPAALANAFRVGQLRTKSMKRLSGKSRSPSTRSMEIRTTKRCSRNR